MVYLGFVSRCEYKKSLLHNYCMAVASKVLVGRLLVRLLVCNKDSSYLSHKNDYKEETMILMVWLV